MPLLPSLQHPFSTCLPLSPLPSSHVCHTLYHFIAPSLPFSFPLTILPFFLFLDKHIFPQSCLCFVNQLSWLHSSLSFSPSLYLPTRLVITSSTVELMAQFRKGKNRRNHVLLLLETESNATQETLLLSCIYAVHMHICGCMHANTQSERQRYGESSWNEKRAQWDAKGESGSPQNISQGKPLLFGSVRAAEEEMPLAAQSCMPPVITSNLIKRSSASGWSASDMLLSNRAR